jgi:hypothetical protein
MLAMNLLIRHLTTLVDTEYFKGQFRKQEKKLNEMSERCKVRGGYNGSMRFGDEVDEVQKKRKEDTKKGSIKKEKKGTGRIILKEHLLTKLFTYKFSSLFIYTIHYC